MLFFASSFSSVDSSFEGSVIVAKKLPIHLLKWEECDTIGKKIGFVVGSAINWTVLTTDKIIDKAVQIFHLDAVGRFCLRILKSIREVTASCLKKIWNVISPYFKRTTVRPIAPENVQVRPEGFSSKIRQFIVDFFRKIYNFLSPICSKIGGYVKDGVRKSAPAFRTIADWTIVPLYNKVLSPLSSSIKNLFNRYSAPCRNALRKIADWTIVPLYNRVLSPAGTIIKDIFYGAFSGLLKKKEDESETAEVSRDSHPSVQPSSEEDEVSESHPSVQPSSEEDEVSSDEVSEDDEVSESNEVSSHEEIEFEDDNSDIDG